MELSEGLMGLLGVAGLFGLISMWCWLEGRAERKRDKQRATYDKWLREQAEGQ